MLASKAIAALAPGTIISGKYRVERPLGAGGMGAVVAARHLELNQIVAIKVLLPTASNTEEATVRFLREGRSAAQLSSPHVAKVHDTGRLPSGEPYLVMELLRGRDLRAHLAEVRRVPLAQAIEWILQTTHALGEAHALHIIHRDIKPANLFLSETAGGPQIKVLDFGISKQLDANDADLTNTSSTVGTPRYMAPEQMRSSRAADARADIWSLGIVLYELTTGRTPFQGDSVTALCFDVMERTPDPPSRINPELPAAFDRVVERCLAKSPSDRFQSMAELATALRPFARGSLYSGLFDAAGPPSNPVAGVTPFPAESTGVTRREGPVVAPATGMDERVEGARSRRGYVGAIPEATPSHPFPVAVPAPPPSQPFPQTVAFLANQPLPPELPPQETMRAWNTTAVPRPGAKARNGMRLLALGIGIGLLVAVPMGILLANRGSSSPAMGTSSAPSAPSTTASLAVSSAKAIVPAESVVVTPAPATSSSAPSTPASDPSTSGSPVSSAPTPAPQPMPPRTTPPLGNCNPPTWTDASGRKHVKPECNH
jgi:hypothetical protein